MGISPAFERHDFVAEIDGYYGVDFVRVGQAWKWIEQANHIRALLVIGRGLQLGDDNRGGEQCVLPSGGLPPFSSPFTLGLNLGPWPSFKVEARDAGLDVDELVHGM